MEPTRQYIRRKQHYRHLQVVLEKRFRSMIRYKLWVMLAGIAMMIIFILNKMYWWSGGAFISSVALLVIIDWKHRRIQENQKWAAILRDMNDQALWRFDKRWSTFPDTGEEFKDDEHPYSSDLDIFGKASLFQWANSGHTFLGRRRLATLLTQPPESASIIARRQQAIGELSKNLKWRQWFSAYGMVMPGKNQDPSELVEWAKNLLPFYTKKAVILGVRSLSLVTLGTWLMLLTTGKIPIYVPAGLLLLQYLFLKIHGKQRKKILNTVFYYRKNIELYQELLAHIEKKSFTTAHLKSMQKGLRNRQEESAGIQLRRLVQIADQVATRDHAMYGIFNTLTLWDYHCLIALENWKQKSGNHLQNWLDTIGELEALSSLAILNYDHPEWTVPEIVENTPVYTAKSLGHPLLPEAARKGNALEIENGVRVLLITGSNMSGKSTYLRTTGINLVLAYAGATVCARSLTCSRMKIYTCMRVSDNLEKNISTFYAEILRIKMIVEATAVQKNVFFLLDEIFKGTNSMDRHLGAKVLIKKLIENQAAGMVSTHDLELGELEQECPQVRNYHFQEFFRDGKLDFDYMLRPGISETRNALYLMRAAGIEVEEEN